LPPFRGQSIDIRALRLATVPVLLRVFRPGAAVAAPSLASVQRIRHPRPPLLERAINMNDSINSINNDEQTSSRGPVGCDRATGPAERDRSCGQRLTGWDAPPDPSRLLRAPA